MSIPLNDLMQMLSNLAVIVTALFVAVTMWDTRRSAKASEKAVQAELTKSISDDISKRWIDVYNMKNEIQESPIRTLSDLVEQYKDDHRKYMASPEWARMRELCAFFERIGLDLYNNKDYINKKELFNKVTVDTFKDENGPVPDGVIYSRLKGPIEYLRPRYRHDLYEFYDKFLLLEYKKYINESEKHPLEKDRLRDFSK